MGYAVTKFFISTFIASFIAMSWVSVSHAAEKKCDFNLQYVFSWPISEGCNDQTRGGTSRGADVKISKEVHQGWQRIQDSKLSKFERDRIAILAMAGGYKVDFSFVETIGFSSDFKRDRPYHSWGTEYVYVIKDEPEFISLQHLMVMYFKQDDGSISDPMVMKHWRQDWTYQDKSMLEYVHNNTWVKRKVKAAEAKGTWSQAVFQVDDSPRYESNGRWIHNPSFSTWLSATTRRPLPRREFSIRNDYDALEGFNRHSITRYGWVQEEDNWKLSLDDGGKPNDENPYLSKELGVARYQLTENVDFTPGDLYMQKTAVFWNIVRSQWAALISANQSLSLKKTVDGQPLFMSLFSSAEKEHQAKDMRKSIDAIITKYVN
jgi:hypothetical protein